MNQIYIRMLHLHEVKHAREELHWHCVSSWTSVVGVAQLMILVHY
jgi:hypothetical protein